MAGWRAAGSSDRNERQNNVVHRPWFAPNEYKQFHEKMSENAENPKIKRFIRHAEQGAVYVKLDMPPGTAVSGLESDGSDRFLCGGGGQSDGTCGQKAVVGKVDY